MVEAVFNVTIIGAGVVGLAIAEELSSRYDDVLVVEKNPSYGQETSSRHSGVIHAGIYYPPGLLKARFCRQGNRCLYETCEKRDIPHERLGKVIVATNEDETQELEKLIKQATENDVTDLTFLSQRELKRMEPEVYARAALFSPSTGIIDSHSLIRTFCLTAESNGVIVTFNSEVTGVNFDGDCYTLEVNNGEYRVETRVLVNAAGLHSDGIAALAGIDIDAEDYRLKYCKGTYFFAAPAPALRHLVYPVPQKQNEGLGIHATLDLSGRVRFGPDTKYVDAIEYTVDEGRQESFYRSIRTYLPGIEKDSLHPDMCGIRPKLQGPGEQYRDFIIKDEVDLGYPGLINLIGIESPGLTSCIPIARYVASLVQSAL